MKNLDLTFSDLTQRVNLVDGLGDGEQKKLKKLDKLRVIPHICHIFSSKKCIYRKKTNNFARKQRKSQPSRLKKKKHARHGKMSNLPTLVIIRFLHKKTERQI